MVQHLGKGKVIITGSAEQHHEAMLLQLNCDKAHQILGWHPRWHVEETLNATAEWYKSIIEGGDAEIITRKQLHQYFNELL